MRCFSRDDAISSNKNNNNCDNEFVTFIWIVKRTCSNYSGQCTHATIGNDAETQSSSREGIKKRKSTFSSFITMFPLFFCITWMVTTRLFSTLSVGVFAVHRVISIECSVVFSNTLTPAVFVVRFTRTNDDIIDSKICLVDHMCVYALIQFQHAL